MKPPTPPVTQFWPRLVFVLFASGTTFLAAQFADLYLLRAFADGAAADPGCVAAGVRPIAYVPVAATAGNGAPAGLPGEGALRVAEVGDGGDLGRRVGRLLASYRPFALAAARENLAYVSLGAIMPLLGGELRWTEGQPQAAVVLPTALITFAPGSATARRNYRQVTLDGPPLAEYGQLKLPLKSLSDLCGLEVELLDNEGQGLYRVSREGCTVHVVVRERMYRLEISRSGRWLQVHFLGQPIKRYPICAGEGNNTPVGDFHIANKAVWPPWNAYWGEYMPGGSARNPLGARWLGTTAHGRETGRVIGIHGTNQPSSIGRRISGGCLRCYNSDAIELFNNIPVGTPVNIHE